MFKYLTKLLAQLEYSIKIIFSLLLLIFPPPSLANNTQNTTAEQVINISAIDWCPQVCLDPKRPGYVVELVKKIFEDTEYQLNIPIYPWSRAIKNVYSGRADALLSPAKDEAPNLRYPQHPVGNQQMCFFNLKSNFWHYSGGINSLEGLQVGIATDTSIEELNEYVKKHPNQFQFQPYHERYLQQSIAKLEKGRMDTFLFTKNSTLFALDKLSKKNTVKLAGCVSKTPIYMAFTPEANKKKRIAAMIAIFDKKLAKLKESKYIEELMKSYNL